MSQHLDFYMASKNQTQVDRADSTSDQMYVAPYSGSFFFKVEVSRQEPRARSAVPSSLLSAASLLLIIGLFCYLGSSLAQCMGIWEEPGAPFISKSSPAVPFPSG